MYVELVISALSRWSDEASIDELVDYVLECRATMLASEPSDHTSAYDALAAQVSYDRALIKLCDAAGVDIDITKFAHPERERSRLEHALNDIGIDLIELSRHQNH